MSREELADLVAAALALPAGERAGFLEARCPGEEDRRAAEAELARVSAQLERGVHRPPAGMTPLAPPVDPWLGRRLGNFHLLRKLGEGGMGRVYLARQYHLERLVAVKVPREDNDLSKTRCRELVGRLQGEARFQAGLRHPFLVPIVTYDWTPEDVPYFVQEYVDGANILDYCRARRSDGRSRLELFGKVLEVVAYCHARRVLHLDIKPGNVMVARDDGEPRLLDFGLAAAETPSHGFGTAGLAAGFSPAYASPEQLAGSAVGPPSDVYSLGLLLFEVLTGHPPFPVDPSADLEMIQKARRGYTAGTLSAALGEGERRQLADVLGPLEGVLVRALAPDPLARFDTAAEFHAEYRERLAGVLPPPGDAELRRVRAELRRAEDQDRRHQALAFARSVEGAADCHHRLLLAARAVELADVPENRGTLVRAAADMPVSRWQRTDPPQGVVTSLAVSRDGTLAASGGADGTVVVRKVATGELVWHLRAHLGAAQALAFHPTRPLLASGGVEGGVRIWDLETGRCATRFDEADPPTRTNDVEFSTKDGYQSCTTDATVVCLAFHPNGTLLAAGGGDGTVRVWTIAPHQGPARRYRSESRASVMAIAICDEPAQVVWVTRDAKIVRWRTQTATTRVTDIPHEDQRAGGRGLAFRPAAVSPCGRVAVVAAGKAVLLVDLRKESPTFQPLERPKHVPLMVAISPRLDAYARSDLSAKVEFRPLNPGQAAWRVGHFPPGDAGPMPLAAFDPTADRAIVCGRKSVGLWEGTRTRTWSWRTPQQADVSAFALRVTADGRHFAASAQARSSGAVLVVNALTAAEHAVSPGHAGRTTCLAFDPTGRRMYSGGIDGTLRGWFLAPGWPGFVSRLTDGWLLDVATCPTGSLVAAVDDRGSVYFCDANTGRLVTEATDRNAEMESGLPCYLGAEVTAVGEKLLGGAVARRKGVALSQDAACPPWHLHAFRRFLAFLPGGGRVLALAGRHLDIVDTTGERRRVPHGGWGTDFVVHPDGGSAVTACLDGILRVIDTRTAEVVRTISAAGTVLHLALSPDGMTLAWAVGGSVYARHLGTGEGWEAEISGLSPGRTRSSGGVTTGLCFSPDGDTVLALRSDNGVVGVRARDGRVLATWVGPGELATGDPDAVRPRLGNAATSADGRVLVTAQVGGPQLTAMEVPWEVFGWPAEECLSRAERLTGHRLVDFSPTPQRTPPTAAAPVLPAGDLFAHSDAAVLADRATAAAGRLAADDPDRPLALRIAAAYRTRSGDRRLAIDLLRAAVAAVDQITPAGWPAAQCRHELAVALHAEEGAGTDAARFLAEAVDLGRAAAPGHPDLTAWSRTLNGWRRSSE